MSRNLLSFTQNRFGPNICSTFNNFSWSENTRKETLQIFMYSFIFFYSMNMNCQCVLKYKCLNPSCDFRTEVQIELTWHGRSCKKNRKGLIKREAKQELWSENCPLHSHSEPQKVKIPSCFRFWLIMIYQVTVALNHISSIGFE